MKSGIIVARSLSTLARAFTSFLLLDALFLQVVPGSPLKEELQASAYGSALAPNARLSLVSTRMPCR